MTVATNFEHRLQIYRQLRQAEDPSQLLKEKKQELTRCQEAVHDILQSRQEDCEKKLSALTTQLRQNSTKGGIQEEIEALEEARKQSQGAVLVAKKDLQAAKEELIKQERQKQHVINVLEEQRKVIKEASKLPQHTEWIETAEKFIVRYSNKEVSS